MYGLKRLTSASHLRALVTSAAAATLFIQSKEGKIQSKNDAATLPKNDGAIYDERTVLPPNVAVGASMERKMLPAELQSENVAMLTCDSSAGGGTCHVYLVGTCHDTLESKREVEAVIQSLKPEVVFLELCSSRLTPENEDGLKRAGRHVGEVVILGDAGKSEFIAAYMQAVKCGAKVILGDRPEEITMQRAMANSPIWHMIKTIMCNERKLLLLSDSERNSYPKKPVEQDPYLKGPIIDERDQYMSAKILEAAREHNLVVAVVGKAHLEGIQKNWKQPVELEQLLIVPSLRTPLRMGSIIAAGLILTCRFIKK